ncbi:unnamed protein product [Diamesa serratosioi]
MFNPKKPKCITGQLALVTGGGNGLGREISLRLAREGCNIVIAEVDMKSAEKTVKEIQDKFSVTVKAFKCDVSKYDEVQKLKVDIESSVGTVDILVNNAGLLPYLAWHEGKPDDVDKIIDVNLKAHFWTCRTFLAGMIERKRGHICAISSISAKATFPNATVYCATKYAVDGFMNALFDELCADDYDEFIKLTTIFPYFINTRKQLTDVLDVIGAKEFTPRVMPKDAANQIVESIMLNKRGAIVPSYLSCLRLTQLLPDKAIKILKKELMDVKKTRKS